MLRPAPLVACMGLLFSFHAVVNPVFAQERPENLNPNEPTLSYSIPANTATGTASATGPGVGQFEDRVIVNWTPGIEPAQSSLFTITRDGDLISLEAYDVREFADFTAESDSVYQYCVHERQADDTEILVACDNGGRKINRPTGFEASSGLFETRVLTTWTDASDIEFGYVLTRDAGNALQFDGANDRVIVGGEFDLTNGFTFEFWASRSSSGTNDYIVNLEALPAESEDRLEIGFTSSNTFVVAFGNDELETADTYTNSDWHHWAVTYNANTLRRSIYLDGVRIETDVVSDPYDQIGDLELGRLRRTGNANRQGHFHGVLDEVRFWNIARSPSEIAADALTLLRLDTPGLTGYWPMDVTSGTTAPDVVGGVSGILENFGGSPWTATSVDEFMLILPADLTAFADETAAPGFVDYAYTLFAYQDTDEDGTYTPGSDIESEHRNDSGWRAVVTPPGNVMATDGQFLDRVRVTWLDMSTSEDSYNIYRDGGLIGSADADRMRFDDLAPIVGNTEYCVEAVAGGVSSIQACDPGRAGGLGRPGMVTASNNEFDDRVLVSWEDSSETESGFEIFRDDVLIGSTVANSTQFGDETAPAVVELDYCVRAFSNADPENISYSDTTCAPGPGLRAITLPPSDVEATDADFEEKVEVTFGAPSKTALLYKVYREGDLIEVLPAGETLASDFEIDSDTDYEYCVSSVALSAAAASKELQEYVAHLISNRRGEQSVAKAMGEVQSTPDELWQQIRASFSNSVVSKTGAVADTVFESGTVCDDGSRSILAPSDVAASDLAEEGWVDVTWTNNSSIAARVVIERVNANTMALALVDTISANRTSIQDFGGVPGQSYRYSVKAFDGVDVSAADEDLGLRELEPVTSLAASDGTSETDVFIEWDDNSDAEDGYRVYRSPSGQNTYSNIGETNANEPAFVDNVSDANRGVLFDYKVVAFDALGESAGLVDQGKTMIQAPINVNASDTYLDTVTVIWTDVSNVEDGYRVTIREEGQATVLIDSTIAPDTTFFGHNAMSGVTYEYCVSSFLDMGGGMFQYSNVACDSGERFVPEGGVVETPDPTKITSTADTDFGHSVAISGTNLLVGQPERTSEEGGVQPYTVNLTTNVLTAGTLYAYGENTTPEHIGFDVAVDGIYSVAGGPRNNGDGDGVYAFWISHVFDGIDQDEDAGQDDFWAGFSVAVADTIAVIGAPLAEDDELGSAFVCNIVASSCNRFGEAFEDLDGVLVTDGGQIGYSVDVALASSSYYAIVGQPFADLAYIFSCSTSANCGDIDNWDLERRIDSPFGIGVRFGAAVSIDADFAVVGAPGDQRVQAYRRSGTTWSESEIFFPTVSSSSFGSAVNMFQNHAIVGAPGETVSGVDSAGAVYVYEFDNSLESWSPATRYDANVSGTTSADAGFGFDVGIGEGVYIVGAPGADAVYSIPFFFEPIDPTSEELNPAENVRASDGDPDDRIRVRWNDASDGEDGYYVYRTDENGEIDLFAEVDPNVEFYDDYDAMPGTAYEYCVAAYLGNQTTNLRCDIGWTPPNGTIAGRLATLPGAGTADAQVCLDPSPNRALLFDGLEGHGLAPAPAALSLTTSITIEAWVLPEDVAGDHYIVSKDGDYALMIKDGLFRYRAGGSVDRTGVPLIVPGQWYHVAVVHDGLSAQFYINGQQIATGIPVSAAADNNNEITIGQKGDGNGYFEGQIDEVRIWNTTRSFDQVTANWDQKLVGDEEGLVAYWPLDQGALGIAPDISETAAHAELSGGVYVSQEGAPIEVCATSDSEGNYTLGGVRYGESTRFQVSPFRSDREFDPDFKTITLSPESPVQNEVDFVDATAYTVAGRVQYKAMSQNGTDLVCPVPDVTIHLSKNPIANDDNARTTTGADGSYALAVDPSVDNSDIWHIMPRFVDPDDGAVVHTFTPDPASQAVLADDFDLDFENTLVHTLSGNFSGGDPGSCGKNIGVAKIRIYTQDGCFSDTLTVNSASLTKGSYTVDLPPLNYLVDIIEITGAPAAREDDIKAFFEGIGTVELDMTNGDVDLDFIYRAPLAVAINGLQPPANFCTTGIEQYDEDNILVRSLDPVKVIGERRLAPLVITVQEDYGNGQFCDVDDGTVSIFDGIGDRAEKDSVMTIQGGEVHYDTFGASANPFGGARVNGIDRSFQKPLTVVARVEGRDPLLVTEWAIVEGSRERASTFVSATTSEMPMLVVHDPPGDASSAFMSEGTSMCHTFTSMKATGGSAGVELDLKIGLKLEVGFGVSIELGGGPHIKTKTVAGETNGSLWEAGGDNFEVCVSTEETWSTSADEKYMMDDVYIGAALNLIFALADELSVDQQACRVDLDVILATDINSADPFETTYAYSESHIKGTLLPMLEELVELDPDGTLHGEDESITLVQAIQNWNAQLEANEELKEEALRDVEENLSFDGGSSYTYESTYDSVYVTEFDSKRIFFNSDNVIGAVFTAAGYDQEIGAAFEVHSEWVTEEMENEGESTALGFTLADDDPGDFYSVNVATDPEFGTPVFGLASGRSSNPWEVGTQPRDRAILSINPPVAEAVPGGGPAVFTLTMTNASESVEWREYILRSILTSNPGGARMTAAGSAALTGGLSFFMDGDPSNASQEVTLTVEPGPAALDYEGLQLQMYPAGEYPIWEDGGVGNSGIILNADTVTFDVFFLSLGTPAPFAHLTPGWNSFSISREGGDVQEILKSINLSDGDMIISDHGEARYDSASGWSGTLKTIVPGYGYKLKVERPSVLVQRGEEFDEQSELVMARGWNFVGYLPTDVKSVDHALESLAAEVSPGDLIVGDEAFAQYVDGEGWVGTLDKLEPGAAYALQLRNGGTLSYPASVAAPVVQPTGTSVGSSPTSATAAASKDAPQRSFDASEEIAAGKMQESVAFKEEPFRTESDGEALETESGSNESDPEVAVTELKEAAPLWIAPREKFAESMTLVLELEKGGVTMSHPDTRIAFFAGDELRGVGSVKRVPALDRDLVFVVVMGDSDRTETDQTETDQTESDKTEDLEIRVYDPDSKLIYEEVGTLKYKPQGAIGSALSPYVIDVLATDVVAQVEEIPEEFALDQNYPNPFNPTTSIKYAVPLAGQVEMSLYDVLGRRVLMVVSGEQEAGRYEVTLDATSLASGTYFYEMKAEGFSAVRKLTVLK